MAVQVAAQRTGLGWLDGRMREAGRHRPARRRRAAFSQVVAKIGVRVRTISEAARSYGWSAGAAAAFSGAGFTVNATAGLIVLGVTLLGMEWRTRE